MLWRLRHNIKNVPPVLNVNISVKKIIFISYKKYTIGSMRVTIVMRNQNLCVMWKILKYSIF